MDNFQLILTVSDYSLILAFFTGIVVTKKYVIDKFHSTVGKSIFPGIFFIHSFLSLFEKNLLSDFSL
jgi:hypothetical protein